mmetsp:Transcript_37055/g.109240  ORF Transcript_37055/g.109240 Transcript_37055/m.109240 type:complete len:202 (+) Transcript_37055:622-1227(+)
MPASALRLCTVTTSGEAPAGVTARAPPANMTLRSGSVDKHVDTKSVSCECMSMKLGMSGPPPALHSHRLSSFRELEMSQPAWPSPPGRPSICGQYASECTASKLWSGPSERYTHCQRFRRGGGGGGGIGGGPLRVATAPGTYAMGAAPDAGGGGCLAHVDPAIGACAIVEAGGSGGGAGGGAYARVCAASWRCSCGCCTPA